MLLFNKIKNCFLTILSFLIVGSAFFIFSILGLILIWFIFIFFGLTTVYTTIKE